jgi:hypothetical protein
MQREPNDHRDGIFKSASPSPPATDGELDADKIEALRLIDKAPFSCVAIFFFLQAVSRFLTVTIVGIILKFV